MATDLTFETKGGIKEYCEIEPEGETVVQIIREDKGVFTVYANLDGMAPVTIFTDSIHKDYIFRIDVPEGVTITIESTTHVISAKTT